MVNAPKTAAQADAGAPMSIFIARMIAYRPGHSLLHFGLDLLRHNRELLVGLLSEAYFDGLAAAQSGLAALPVTTIVILLALEGLAEVALTTSWLATGGSLSFRKAALLWYNMLARILELPGARALPADVSSGDGTSDEGPSDSGASNGVPSGVGEILSTLRDDVWQLEWISTQPFDLAVTLIESALALGTLLAIDAQVTLWILAPLLPAWGIGLAMRKPAERLWAASRTASAAYSGALNEALTLVQAIQVAGAEESVAAHLSRRGTARQEADLREGLYSSLLHYVFAGWHELLVTILLLASSDKMLAGTFTVGELSLFVIVTAQVATSMSWSVNKIAVVRTSRPSLRRLLALMQGAPLQRLTERRALPLRKAPPPQPSPGRLEQSEGAGAASSSPPWALRGGLRGGAGEHLETLKVKGLTVRHPGSEGRSADKPAGIEDVSFELARGTLNVVVGRIGAGKSTLLRALLGLLPLDGGEVRWNGRLVGDPRTFLRPPRAGYTPQVPGLLSATLRENVLLDWPATHEELDAAVHAAVLERDVAEFPEGLDTLIGVRGRRLSGGQVQRTALARMLVRRPELLVMDDVSSALDVETEQVLWQRLLGRGAVVAPGGWEDPSASSGQAPAPTAYVPTCLVVSHRRAVLERADQILLLEGGQIIDRGTLVELLARSPEMRRLCAEEGEP